MINIPGQLAVRTITGRNGPFNVGRLATSIGEFVIKDALLDQYTEGKYRGDFAITQIRPSYYTHGGRLVVEIRAELDSMSLEDVTHLSAEDAEQMSSTVLDPLEEQGTASTPQPEAPVGTEAPFGMQPSTPIASTEDEDADARLFGSNWPLGQSVRLDTTVDRQRLRAQCARLGELGYELDFKRQVWERSAAL